ncbi:MAG TPA: hypothetical protein P5277_01330 [Candidatus Paceibacterota bacterium]|nr:hypothetical protein [Candidatus Paceibacterota bacterium]
MGDKIFDYFEAWFMCMLLIFVGLAIGGGAAAFEAKKIIAGGGISAIISLFAVLTN